MSQAQSDLNGNLTPIPGKDSENAEEKRECHVWISERAFRITDNVKFFKDTFKSDFADAMFIIGQALEPVIPLEVLLGQRKLTDEEIRETFYSFFSRDI